MFETNFKLTEQELYEGLVAISRGRRITKIFRIIGVIWSVSYLLILISYMAAEAMPNLYSVVFLLFGIYMIFLSEISAKFQSRNLIKENSQITEKTTYVFDGTGYQLTGESFSIRLAYSKLYEVREVGNLILFQVSEGSANIVPKRSLSSDQFNTLKKVMASVSNLKSKFYHEQVVQ